MQGNLRDLAYHRQKRRLREFYNEWLSNEMDHIIRMGCTGRLGWQLGWLLGQVCTGLPPPQMNDLLERHYEPCLSVGLVRPFRIWKERKDKTREFVHIT